MAEGSFFFFSSFFFLRQTKCLLWKQALGSRIMKKGVHLILTPCTGNRQEYSHQRLVGQGEGLLCQASGLLAIRTPDGHPVSGAYAQPHPRAPHTRMPSRAKEQGRQYVDRHTAQAQCAGRVHGRRGGSGTPPFMRSFICMLHRDDGLTRQVSVYFQWDKIGL